MKCLTIFFLDWKLPQFYLNGHFFNFKCNQLKQFRKIPHNNNYINDKYLICLSFLYSVTMIY